MQTDLNARIFRSCSCTFIHRHGHRTHFHLPQAIQHARVLALINIVLKEEPRHLEKRQRRHQRVASGLVRRPNALDLCVCVCVRARLQQRDMHRSQPGRWSSSHPTSRGLVLRLRPPWNITHTHPLTSRVSAIRLRPPLSDSQLFIIYLMSKKHGK